MSQPKDYDSTLARMAGNIAAGLAAKDDTSVDRIADDAVLIARTIVALCRALQAKETK